jgi:hypothetical protein
MKEHLRNKWPYYFAGLIILIIILFEARGKGDFNIFISASRDLLSGKNIYQIQYNEWYHYYYDILFALILAPFTYLPLYVVKLIWLILNVFFVYRIWKILMEWLPVSLLKKNSKKLFIILSFIFILSFLRDNFHLAQVTIFILYLTLEGLFFINNNKSIAGSLLIAMGINIKLLPIVIIPYLIYRNQWKSAFYIIGFMVVFLCLPMVFIGVDYNNFLLIERWHLINPMNQAHILDTSERSFHSLTTLLATLLVKDCGDWHALTLKRNIANISIENLNIVINVVRGALLLFTLYFLKTKPFKKTTEKLQNLYEISYICLIIPLIFPHQQYYAFFFIFPASTYLLFYLVFLYFNKVKNKINKYFNVKKITLIVLISIVYFLTNSHFILGVFNKYYDHYKTLTYGVLILMVLLAICKPDKLLTVEQPTHNSV